MVRSHNLHRDAADERARLAKIERHENAVRLREREREDRRHIHLVQQEDEYRDCFGERMPNEDIAVDGLW